jgi:integrase/recombinase XerD
MKFSTALEGFYLSRTAEGKSPETVKIYRWSLVPLCEFLGDPEVESVSTQQLRSYLAQLTTAGKLSALSIQMVHRCIRAFYSWAEVDLELPRRPDKVIRKPEGKGEEIQPFTLSEVDKLLKGCEYTKIANTNGNRRIFQMRRSTAKRDRAIVLFLLDAGVRAGEMCRLSVGDINLESGEAVVRPYHSSHKSRPRVVPFGKTVKRALWVYLAERGKPAADEPLFLSGDEQGLTRFTPNHLGKLIRALGERVGVNNAHPHRLRHTMAIQYLRNRGDPFTLKRILGLASWQIMQVYIQLANSDVQDVHRHASPADGWRL